MSRNAEEEVMGFSLGMGRDGYLVGDEEAEMGMGFMEEDARVVRLLLQRGDVAVLLWLAGRWPADGLPPVAMWWRELVNEFLKGFCAGVSGEGGRNWERWLKRMPLMKGGEQVTVEVLERLWSRLAEAVEKAVVGHAGGREGWLREALPQWHLVGRVTLHLAENPRNLERPFAFMATYTSGLNEAGEVRHLPLQQAVKSVADKKDKEGLLKLLEPLSRAAEESELMKEMVEGGTIYRARAWSPGRALQFLKEVPLLERCGLAVRIPDWWKSGGRRRVLATVKVGEEGGGGGGGGVWRFDVALTLGGEKLTKEEMEALSTAQGLVLLKGRWVEVDAGRLKAVMEHWQKARMMQFQGGMTFLQAMRLLAGVRGVAGVGSEEKEEDLREWSEVVAEGRLAEVLEQMRDPQRLRDLDEQVDLRAELRQYQREGVNWLRFLVKLGLGACLADDMGLGKTMQVLALLLQLKRIEPGKGPALLVAPASLLLNWQMEAVKFAPTLRVLVAHGSGEEVGVWQKLSRGDERPLLEADLVLTTYGMVSRLACLSEVKWRLVVLDEAQAIKNPASIQAQAVKRLEAWSRIALTGTPIENRMTDLWSLFDFINPGLLGNLETFQRLVKWMTQGERADFEPLRKLVSPYLLRRLKTDKRIIRDLPEKVEVVSWCALTKPQAVLYQQAVETLRARLAEVEEELRSGVVLSALMTFKQICNHPAQHSGDVVYETGLSGKFLRLRELAEGMARGQEKVLVFTQFTQVIPALRTLLREVFGREGLVLTGSTPVVERRELVEKFQAEGGPPFFILSLKAGGTGLTLTAASQVVHFDRWWNPAVENQATDRAFRIGQRRNVLVHKLVCRGTLEERIDRLIEQKKSLAEGVLGGEAEKSILQMGDEELMELVSLDLGKAMVGWEVGEEE